MQIAKDTVVALDVQLSDVRGNLIQQSAEAVQYLHGGYDGIFPAVEAALQGRAQGDKIEVRLEPVLPAEIPDGCNECQLVLLFHFQTVYTRRSPSIRDGGAEPLPSSPGRRSGVVGSPG